MNKPSIFLFFTLFLSIMIFANEDPSVHEINTLLKNNLANNLDREFNGKTHLMLKKIASEKLKEYIPVLVENITWKIDENSLPQGKKYPSWIVYPVAITLRDLGGNEVNEIIINKLNEEGNEEKLKLLTWVLKNHKKEKDNAIEDEIEKRIFSNKKEQIKKYFTQGDLMFSKESDNK